MKDGKTPGNDGVTKNFTFVFFEELGSLKYLIYSYSVGELFTLQKLAVITLIKKKERGKRLVKN